MAKTQPGGPGSPRSSCSPGGMGTALPPLPTVGFQRAKAVGGKLPPKVEPERLGGVTDNEMTQNP